MRYIYVYMKLIYLVKYIHMFKYGDVHGDASFISTVFPQIFSNNCRKQSKINIVRLLF